MRHFSLKTNPISCKSHRQTFAMLFSFIKYCKYGISHLLSMRFFVDYYFSQVLPCIKHIFRVVFRCQVQSVVEKEHQPQLKYTKITTTKIWKTLFCVFVCAILALSIEYNLQNKCGKGWVPLRFWLTVFTMSMSRWQFPLFACILHLMPNEIWQSHTHG